MKSRARERALGTVKMRSSSRLISSGLFIIPSAALYPAPHKDHTAPIIRLQVAREDRRENGTYAEVTST
jgi:hypothetical protein